MMTNYLGPTAEHASYHKDQKGLAVGCTAHLRIDVVDSKYTIGVSRIFQELFHVHSVKNQRNDTISLRHVLQKILQLGKGGYANTGLKRKELLLV